MKRIFFILFLLIAMSVFAFPVDKKIIRVAAAANLSYAMDSLRDAFLKI